MLVTGLLLSWSCGSDGDPEPKTESVGDGDGDGDTPTDAGAETDDDASSEAVSGAAQSEEGVDPCSLLQVSEIEPLFGTTAGPGVRSGDVCKWKPASGPGSVTVQVEDDGPSVYDHEKELLGVDEELTDIGDKAFRSGFIVGALVGDLWISVGVAPNIGVKTTTTAEVVALAKTAVARLPR